MASRVAGSRSRRVRCWPTGRPVVWVGCSRRKVNIVVSRDMVFLEERVALDQDLGLRKMGLGVSFWRCSLFERRRAVWLAESRVPMW